MPAQLEPVDDGVAATDHNGVAATDPNRVAATDQNRVAATDHDLRRQLAQRTAEVATLRAEVADLTARLAPGALTPQVAEWRAKAAEYDALMATKTMHAVRIPRAIYGRILARRART